MGLGERPATVQLPAQLVMSSGINCGHAALSAIQSFCESAALATR